MMKIIFRVLCRQARGVFLFPVVLAFTQLSALAVGSVNLVWNPSPDTDIDGYNIYYGSASGNYTNKISVGNVTNTMVVALAEGVQYFFAATAYNKSGLESDPSNEASYSVPIISVNQPPTLSALNNLVLNENAGLQTVALAGLSSGAPNENQTLSVTAVSSNPALIPNPAVSYTSANLSGSLAFTPVAFASGSATVTVTVNDGQSANGSFSRSFTVTVNPVNQPPTLSALNNLVLNENAGLQTVALAGLSSDRTSVV